MNFRGGDRTRRPPGRYLAIVDRLTERPSWRGWLHVAAFFVAVPAGIFLVSAADTPSARTASVLYAISLLLVFGTSAVYHRLALGTRRKAILQRVDHSMIFLLILGTYVPLCLVALPPAWGIPLLAIVSAGALLGIVLKLVAFGRAQWIAYALYPILGWAAVIAAPALLRHLTPVELGLVIAGGLAYTIGFPVLLVRRPDPWPRSFGYHEVWHSFTVVAAGLHFAAVAAVVA